MTRATRIRKHTLLALVALGLSLSGSCQGCPQDTREFLPFQFGTLNPLFDRVTFVDQPGQIINPSTDVEKRVRVEMTLPVEPASIGADSLRALVVPDSVGPIDQLPNQPPPIVDQPTDDPDQVPIEVIPVTVGSLEPKLEASGFATALEATLDADELAAHTGRQLVIQLDPSGWAFAPGAEVSDQVFSTPMRFTFRVGQTPPDGDPPVVADVVGFSTVPLREVLRGGGLDTRGAIVPPHARLEMLFSEPLASVAPAMDPQDPTGLQLRAGTRADGAVTSLVTQTQAGMVPGEEYCISLLPPQAAQLGPLAWGTQDLTGEPLIPEASPPGSPAPERGDLTDLCFQTGAARIEQPKPDALMGIADGADINLEALLRRQDPGTPAEAFRVQVREHDGSDELPTDWTEVGFFELDSATVEVLPVQSLVQGELEIPVDGVRVPLDDDFVIPICSFDPEGRCKLDFRVDHCTISRVCEPGDIVDGFIDAEAPPDLAQNDVNVEDTDNADGVIDRVCAELSSPEADEELVVDLDDPSTEECRLRLGTDAPGSRSTGWMTRECDDAGRRWTFPPMTAGTHARPAEPSTCRASTPPAIAATSTRRIG